MSKPSHPKVSCSFCKALHCIQCTTVSCIVVYKYKYKCQSLVSTELFGKALYFILHGCAFTGCCFHFIALYWFTVDSADINLQTV